MAGLVGRAIRDNIVPGMTIHTSVRRASFVVDTVDERGVVLLLGRGRFRTPLSWDCLEGIPSFLRGRGWVRIGGVFSVDSDPGALDGYMKQYTKRAAANWVASLLTKAGIVEVDPEPPARIRLRLRDVVLFDTWHESVQIDTHLAAIRWKANLPRDREHIRSRHSEDRLTWIVYRALEGEGLVPQFCHEVLGLPPAERVWVYYWQRLPNSEFTDPEIHAALEEVEPWHTAHERQTTETDIILVARNWLCLCELKCGSPNSEPHGWQQAKGSPLRPEYERFFRPLLRNPATWQQTGRRFAQLLKRLSLGQALARRWSVHSRALDVHLGVVINDRVCGKKGDTYVTEFEAFRSAVTHPVDHLHLATWQRIREWLGRQEPLCRKACHAMDENDCL